MLATTGGLIRVELKLPNSSHVAVVDSGATCSCVGDTIAGLYPSHRRSVPEVVLRLGNGEALLVSSALRLPFSAGPARGVHDFVVLPGLPVPCLLGLDLLRGHNLAIHAKYSRLVPLEACLTLDVCPTALPLLAPLGAELTPVQHEVLECFCREFQDVFSSDSRPFGKTSLIAHQVDTGASPPISQGLRPTSPAGRDIVRTEVAKMLEAGAIRPSSSPWASPVVLVGKKDGSTRFCVDFRKINNVTRKDVFPLPRTSDLLESLAAGRFFTTLDAASGYWQIPMAPKDMEKTAFLTSEGLYEFKVMPFGLCNAPATYQRFMNSLLAGLNWVCCLVYLDDIIIFSASFEQHLRDVRAVLERLRKAGLLLKGKKCLFGARKVCYLGHILSSEGIAVDPAKVVKLKAFPAPTDKVQVRAFLGLAGYYRRFVRNFSLVAAPLFDLLKDDAQFGWGEPQAQAFKQLIDTIAAEAVLSHPRFDLPFLVDSDASDIGLGAVLSQVVEGVERPLMFASRRLQPAERPWPIREKEALGIIWALESFRHFILGSNFTVRTDHSSLTSLRAAKTGRLARWALRLAEFGDFDVKHRAGRLHSNCDAFTRLAESDCVPEHATLLNARADAVFSWTELVAAQAADKWCRAEVEESRLGKRPAFEISEGALCLRVGGIVKPLIPLDLRRRVLGHFHGLCHFGGKKTASLVRDRFHWPGLVEDTKLWVKNCVECTRRKSPTPKSGLLGSTPPTEPWRVVAMDFCGPYATDEEGCRFVLVFVDQFTKWVELCPTKDQLAPTVIRLFYERIVCRHGAPSFLLSDRGPQFKSHAVEAVCAAFGVRKIFSSAYYPQGDGFAERFMRTLNNSLSILARKSVRNWSSLVPGIQLGYNASQHAATGHSPFLLNTGRVPTLPGETITPILSCPKTAEALVEVIRTANGQARQTVEAYWERMKARFDRNRKELKLEVGDSVLVRLSDYERRQFPCIKLAPRWSAPAKVVGAKSNGVTYDVKRSAGGIEAVHITRLLPLALGARIPEEEASTPVGIDPSSSRPVVMDVWAEDSDSESVYLPSIYQAPAPEPVDIPSLVRDSASSADSCIVDVPLHAPLPDDVYVEISESASSGPGRIPTPPVVVDFRSLSLSS